jgi:hypothetical protein
LQPTEGDDPLVRPELSLISRHSISIWMAAGLHRGAAEVRMRGIVAWPACVAGVVFACACGDADHHRGGDADPLGPSDCVDGDGDGYGAGAGETRFVRLRGINGGHGSSSGSVAFRGLEIRAAR